MAEVAPKRSNRAWSMRAIDERSIATLRPYAGNARTHSRRQIRQLADSITRFGFTNPVLIADGGPGSPGSKARGSREPTGDPVPLRPGSVSGDFS